MKLEVDAMELDILVMMQKEKRVDGSAVTVSRHVEKSRESKSRGSNTTQKKVEEKIPGFYF